MNYIEPKTQRERDYDNTLKLVLLAVSLYAESDHGSEAFNRMMRDIGYDTQHPNEMVPSDWLQSHGF